MNRFAELIPRIDVGEMFHKAVDLAWTLAPWHLAQEDLPTETEATEKIQVNHLLIFEELSAYNFDRYVHDMQQRMQELKGYFDNQSQEIRQVVYQEVNEIYSIVGGMLGELRRKKFQKRDQAGQDSSSNGNQSLVEQSTKLSGHFEKLDSYRMNTDMLQGIDFQSDLGELETEVNKIIAAL